MADFSLRRSAERSAVEALLHALHTFDNFCAVNFGYPAYLASRCGLFDSVVIFSAEYDMNDSELLDRLMQRFSRYETYTYGDLELTFLNLPIEFARHWNMIHIGVVVKLELISVLTSLHNFSSSTCSPHVSYLQDCDSIPSP